MNSMRQSPATNPASTRGFRKTNKFLFHETSIATAVDVKSTEGLIPDRPQSDTTLS